MAKFTMDKIKNYIEEELLFLDDEANGQDNQESLWYIYAPGGKPFLKIEREAFNSNAIVMFYKKYGQPAGECKNYPFEQVRSEDEAGICRMLREIYQS